MRRTIGFVSVGMLVLMTAAMAATPAVSRPGPTPSIRPPTASARPFIPHMDVALQKGGGGGGKGGGGFGGGGKGFGGGPGFGGGFGGGKGFGGGFGGPGGFGIGIGIGPFLPKGPPPYYYGGYGGYYYGPYSYPYYYNNYPYSYYPYNPTQRIEVLPAPPTDTGLRITEILDGAAKKAALREGDIIVIVGKARVRTFDELVLALANVTGPVEFSYIAGGSGKVEKAMVTPVDGKIGVAVVPVDVNLK